jgi:hypothetical protein
MFRFPCVAKANSSLTQSTSHIFARRAKSQPKQVDKKELDNGLLKDDVQLGTDWPPTRRTENTEQGGHLCSLTDQFQLF